MALIGTNMVSDDRTARQIFDEVMANPARRKFGFGSKLAIVNVDFQQAYTRTDMFATAYETDPDQIAHVNRISDLARTLGMPVIWSRVGYMNNAADAGVWGTRTDTPDSLQNIKYGSERHAFDPRCVIDADDMQFTKRMPSAFFDTPLAAYLVWHKVDTVVVTGGSTSGCVRATAVDALSKPAPTSMRAIISRTSPTCS
jgi:maleamate amidohydrolase